MKMIKTLFLTLAAIAVIVQGSAVLADSGSLSASFMASVNTGRAPLTVQFTDTSGGSPTGWHWDFGDGSYSTLQNPVYTFNTPGTYTVTLTATDGAQSDTMSSDIVVSPPLAVTPTPTPGQTPVIIVPIKDPHHAQPPHKDHPPVHKQPADKDKSPVHKHPSPTAKPTEKPGHK